MFRNFQPSKQTEDKVKLAKQFIESKYSTILAQQQNNKITWQRVMKTINQAPIPNTQKKIVAQKLMVQEASQTRQLRVKDKLSNYELLGMIGKGAFGDVRLARNRQTDEVVAIKRMAKQKLVNKKQVASVFLERQCLSKTRSKWLVELKSAFQDTDYLYIVMQWVPGGDLLRLLIEKDIFSQEETRFYIGELLLALEDMHRMHYIHRDIKPDNILIDNSGHLKLTDFGLSKHLPPVPRARRNQNGRQSHKNSHKPALKRLILTRQRHFSKVGTPDYIAPQVLTEQTYDQRVDIWSVGVIMFQCLFGYPLFSHEDSHQVCQRVINWEQHLIFPDNSNVSLEAKLLILGMLSSPDHRLTISQIKCHQFFAGFDWGGIKQSIPPFVPQLNHELDTRNFDSFEEQQWLLEKRCQERKSTEARSNSLGYQYNFAGFDWQPKPSSSHLALTLKEIQNLSKVKRGSAKPMRRLKTEQSQLERKTSPDIKAIRNSLKMYEVSRRQDKADHRLKKVFLKRA